MRDLILIVTTSILTIALWAGLKPKYVETQQYESENILEKAVKIGDTIDAEFIKKLSK